MFIFLVLGSEDDRQNAIIVFTHADTLLHLLQNRIHSDIRRIDDSMKKMNKDYVVCYQKVDLYWPVEQTKALISFLRKIFGSIFVDVLALKSGMYEHYINLIFLY